MSIFSSDALLVEHMFEGVRILHKLKVTPERILQSSKQNTSQDINGTNEIKAINTDDKTEATNNSIESSFKFPEIQVTKATQYSIEIIPFFWLKVDEVAEEKYLFVGIMEQEGYGVILTSNNDIFYFEYNP